MEMLTIRVTSVLTPVNEDLHADTVQCRMTPEANIAQVVELDPFGTLNRAQRIIQK